MRLLTPSFVLFVVAAMAPVFAQVAFLNTDYSGVEAGEPFVLGWTGETGPVTVLLKTGPATSLTTVETIVFNNTGGSWLWTPSAELLPNTLYTLEIESGVDVVYSPQFEVKGATGTGTSAPSSSKSTQSYSSTSSSEPSSTSFSQAQSTTSANVSAAQTSSTGSTAGHKLKPGGIAGIFLGVLSFVLAVITLIWFCLRRRRLARVGTTAAEPLTPAQPELPESSKWVPAAVILDAKPEMSSNSTPLMHDYGFPATASPGVEPFPDSEPSGEHYHPATHGTAVTERTGLDVRGGTAH